MEEMIISLDRLSRFKLPEESFNRVFSSVIEKYLIFPKFSKKQISELPPEYIVKIVERIWNQSVKQFSPSEEKKQYNIIKFSINSTFKNIPEYTNKLINAKLNIKPVLRNVNLDNAPINLKFLAETADLDKAEIINFSQNRSLKFPIRKLIIVEGITEEILLPVFANKMGHNFDKDGIFILGAGGKSKSPSLYMKLRDRLKIPVIFLFDADAIEIANALKNVILKKDRIVMIADGEFEDILPIKLIKRSLNHEYDFAEPVIISDFNSSLKMCSNLGNLYRNKHLGEFKKAKFSKIIADNIKYESDISDEIRAILKKICM